MPPQQKINFYEYQGVDNTLENIYKIIQRHKNDSYLSFFADRSIPFIFNYIKDIPYKADPSNLQSGDANNGDDVELLQSPYYTMFGSGNQLITDPATGTKYIKGPSGDCDDKAIVAGCIFERKGIRYRMKVVSTRPDQELHHIYLEIFYNGAWVPFDATYPQNQLFSEKKSTKAILYDWINNSLQKSEITPANLKQLYAVPLMQQSQMLGGYSVQSRLHGTKLATLEGDSKPVLLGFIDPVTLIAVGSTVISFLSHLFSSQPYIDAYHVYDQMATMYKQNNTSDPNLLIAKAVMGILGVDYMDPAGGHNPVTETGGPAGANVCTSANHCGNRAEWSVIQNAVMAKAQQVAPFMGYLQNVANSQGQIPWSEGNIGQYYVQYKTNGPLYQQFLQWAQANGVSSSQMQSLVSQSGIGTMSGSTLLLIGALAVGGILIFNKKKKRGKK